jgi:hypothetical protein
MILLSEKQPITSGGEKFIFHHPEDSSKLIKVINPTYIDFMKKNRSITYRLRRLKHYWFVANQVIEHIASREEDIDNKHFLQTVYGFVDTDMGLGIVVNAIKNDDNSLGFTLGDLIKNKQFNQVHKKALECFIEWMKITHIIIRDLWLDNLVWDEKGQYFVLVDGIGGRYLPTLRSYCRWYNLRGNKKRANKLLQRVERYFNKQ